MYFAAIASSRQSFLSNSFSFRHSFKPKSNINYLTRPNSICCKSQHDEDKTDSSRKNENQLAKLAIATLAVGVLALGSVGDASAAKSGGRVGGQAFRSSAPRPPPRINNRSRTNIYVNPPVAPPLIGGYGYGGYGGYGWSPFSFFAPGPAVAVGVGGGFDILVLFMFLGAASAVARNFFRSRNEEDDEDDY
uniref:Transmembrane protein n=1 Tax=Noccaea caerulescens TaxID=107243 RepID=A0A1J3H7E0_NOCCA